MKVSKLIKKLTARRDKYLSTGQMTTGIVIHKVIAKLLDHVIITGDHEMGADWKLDA